MADTILISVQDQKLVDFFTKHFEPEGTRVAIYCGTVPAIEEITHPQPNGDHFTHLICAEFNNPNWTQLVAAAVKHGIPAMVVSTEDIGEQTADMGAQFTRMGDADSLANLYRFIGLESGTRFPEQNGGPVESR